MEALPKNSTDYKHYFIVCCNQNYTSVYFKLINSILNLKLLFVLYTQLYVYLTLK